ncbi:MAG: hypothetical protein AB1758_31395, partial [Candidatus Eremiobacterota bacterium]
MRIRELPRLRLPAPAAPRPAKAPARAPRRKQVYDRSDRITHWLRGLQERSLANLRGAAAAYAGQMVGMAVGAALFAPLSVATGNVFVFFGGSTLLGCGAALGAYRWDRRQAQRMAGHGGLPEAALGAGMVAQAVPKFAYPSLLGATAADRALVVEALDRMPMGSVTSLSTVHVVPGLDRAGVGGVAYPAFSQNLILLDRDSLHWGWGFHR